MTGKINFAKILILLLGVSLLYSQKQNINSKLTYPSLDKTLSETNSNLQTKNLSDTELIHSAMEFSECSPAEEKQILEKYNSIKTQVMKLAETESSEEKVGKQILLLMYENILNQYRRNETTMQAAFLNETYNDIAYNTADNLCNKGQYKTAALIPESRKSYLTSANINEIEQMVIATELNEETKPLAADEALAYLKNKLSENTAQIQNPKIQKTIQSLYEYYVQIKVNDEQKNGRYINAAQIARENLKIFPQSRIIKNLSEQALKNHAVYIHNNFAESANKKDYEQARKILLEGLSQNSASSILKNDLHTLEQITGSAR